MNSALFILPFIIVALITAIWTGWIRIGVQLPMPGAAMAHGTLMINSFLAALIYLERAVTFSNKWVLALPLASAFSAILMLSGHQYAAHALNILCSFGFLLMCAFFVYRYKETYYYVFFAGAFCLLTGNIALLNTQLYPAASIWWMQFLLFTIVAERLELSRFLPVSLLQQRLLMIILGLVLTAAFIPYHHNGNLFFAATLSATALWLLKNDMAFKSIRLPGQHRYSGLLLIAGYLWLLVTAVLLWWEKQLLLGYDAVLHSFFIGFVFSMIFSHAPVILPAVAKLNIKIYRPALYAWAILLQLSLIARIAADIVVHMPLRRLAGLVNGLTMLLFLVSIAVITVSEARKKRRRHQM